MACFVSPRHLREIRHLAPNPAVEGLHVDVVGVKYLLICFGFKGLKVLAREIFVERRIFIIIGVFGNKGVNSLNHLEP